MDPTQFSLGSDKFAMFSDMASYPHVSPAACKMRGPAWMCACELKGDIAKIGNAWLSLLVSPGCLVNDSSEVGGGRGAFKQCVVNGFV